MRQRRGGNEDLSPVISPPTPTSTTSPPSSSSLLPLVLTTSLYALLLLVLTSVTSHLLPSPYMDEPFHLHQTAAYCRLSFTTWDPKITTLPGLYFASLALHSLTLPFSLPCDLPTLRLYNTLWAVAAFLLFYLLTGALRPPSHPSPLSPTTRLLRTLQFGLFPLHFFYIPLYYTDTFATFTALLTLYTGVSQVEVTSSPSPHWVTSPLMQLLVGGVAVMARQTNVVWVAFTALYLVVTRWANAKGDGAPQSERELTAWEGLHWGVWRCVVWMWSNAGLVVRLVWPYAVVVAAFVAFLVWNGGSVVVGDRSNHQFSPHIGQLLHFVGFTGAFLCPLMAGEVRGLIPKSLEGSVWLTRVWLPVVVLVMWALKFGMRAHAFLLADNRHVTYFVWRYFFGWRDVGEALLDPVVLCGGVWDMERAEKMACDTAGRMDGLCGGGAGTLASVRVSVFCGAVRDTAGDGGVGKRRGEGWDRRSQGVVG